MWNTISHFIEPVIIPVVLWVAKKVQGIAANVDQIPDMAKRLRAVEIQVGLVPKKD